MGVFQNGGTPIAGWLISENPTKIWMITRGTPIFMEPPIGTISPLAFSLQTGMTCVNNNHFIANYYTFYGKSHPQWNNGLMIHY